MRTLLSNFLDTSFNSWQKAPLTSISTEPASKVYITRRSRLSLKTIGKHCWSELHQSSQEQTSKLLYYLERRSPDLLFCKFCGKLHKPCVNCASLRQLQANFTGMEPGWLKFPGTPVSPIHFDYAYMIMRVRLTPFSYCLPEYLV